ncbi:hypothetical protein Tco_0768425 [Tanacetum coccineum]
MEYINLIKEHLATLHELLEQARALRPSDENMDYASKFAQRIQELFVYVYCNENVKNVVLKSNSKNVCLTCNDCLFSANHDACVVNYLNDVQKRKKAKSVKQKEKIEWKQTGRFFNTIGHKWLPTGRIFSLVGNKCPVTKITPAIIVPSRNIVQTTVILVVEPRVQLRIRYANARNSISRSYINNISHPFNDNDFGLVMRSDDQEPPP